MTFLKRNAFISSLLFIYALSLLESTACASEPSPIRVYKAFYALEFTTQGGEVNWIIDGVAQKKPGPAAALTKSVIALINETSVDTSIRDKDEKNFMVAREAYFRARQEKSVNSPPMYLLHPGWMPCLIQSKKQMIVTSGTDKPNKKNLAWKALLLQGCATNPNQYASLVVEGNNIDDIYWINENNAEKKFKDKLSAQYYRAPDYYKGMSPQMVELDKKLQAEYRREDETEFKHQQEKSNKQADEIFTKFNELLKQSNAKVTPVHRAQKIVSIDDSRIQAFINAVANDATFKNAKPLLFIVSGNRQLLLFRQSDSKTLKLTEIRDGRLNIIQTQTTG